MTWTPAFSIGSTVLSILTTNPRRTTTPSQPVSFNMSTVLSPTKPKRSVSSAPWLTPYTRGSTVYHGWNSLPTRLAEPLTTRGSTVYHGWNSLPTRLADPLPPEAPQSIIAGTLFPLAWLSPLPPQAPQFIMAGTLFPLAWLTPNHHRLHSLSWLELSSHLPPAATRLGLRN